jgi:hypothetical protein
MILSSSRNFFADILPPSYAYFSPSIINGYGYGKIQTQLHSVPPWAAAFAFAMILAYLSDKTRHRFGYAVFAVCVAIVGFAILISVHDNRPLEYAALFLVAMGCYSAMPIIVCWFSTSSHFPFLLSPLTTPPPRYEPRRPSPPQRRLSLASRLRQHRRHHRRILFLED